MIFLNCACECIFDLFNIHTARKEWLGLVTAMVVGLQHALAMVGGLIVPPTLIVPFGVPNRTALIQYLVQAALIVCGIMTAVQGECCTSDLDLCSHSSDLPFS